MNKEILTLVDVLASEKNVTQTIVFAALEEALASATKRLHKDAIDVRVDINRGSGIYTTYRRWLVVPNEQGLEHPEKEVLLFEAQEDVPSIEIGDWIEEEIDSIDLGRIGAQAAKQVILQRVREAEREQILEDYLATSDGLFMGVVRRADRKGFIIDSGKIEAFLPKEETISKENFRVGDRVKAYIQGVDREARGPQLEVSRTSADFLIKLFENEVPEIENGTIEIIAAARDPGVRAKVAVRSLESRLDPIGAMVGVRGTRIMAVRNQICNEAIDVIIWSEDMAQYVMNALAPAQISSIVLDEERRVMEVVVEEEELAIAIGRGGQNVRLASDLTGWSIDVLSTAESYEKQAQESEKAFLLFKEKLELDDESAERLIHAQISTLEEIAYMPIEELQAAGLKEEALNAIRIKAREALLMIELTEEERIEGGPKALSDLDGMTAEIIAILASNQINNLDDLAELSTDELIEITSVSETDAKDLILKARAHWFETPTVDQV